MPEIGASLREARMRQRIDITEVEADTKIRGKYLRALENEEWELLPGPTFVKSFLRTYADYLGLDGRPLVEEYKLHFERPEMQAIAPPRPREQGRGRQRGGRGGPPGRRADLARPRARRRACSSASSSWDAAATRTRARPLRRTATRSSTTSEREPASGTPARPRVATLQIIPTGQLYVCLRDAAGRRLLDGVVLQPGAETKTYRSRRLRLTLGNGDARLVVNGSPRPVPDVERGDRLRDHRRRLHPALRLRATELHVMPA